MDTEDGQELVVAIARGKVEEVTLTELHERTAHTSKTLLKNMVRNGLLQGIVLKDDISNFCVPCQKVKSTRGTFGQETLRGSSALDLVVSDVAGAVQESAAGNKYYVSIGDDWSGLTLVKAMAAKSMVPQILIGWI
ncbi:hypothetical protein CF326_g3116 [Tilletia indica]|nr:hypothetical protein CF326_g3116 [Tilletia indica]